MNLVRVHLPDLQHSHRLVRSAAVLLLALASVGTSAAYAQEAQQPVSSVEPVAGASIDGTWTIDTELGDFEDYSSSWIGFRVAEVLDNIGENEAVGRTPDVSGELVAAGATIESARIEADLSAIRSNPSRREPAIQRALETSAFPTATFESSGPVDLGAVPVDGEPFSAAVPGILTIRDVSQDVILEMAGQRVGDIVVVVGTLPLDFTSFGVTMPTAPAVISVEDSGDLEWQLFFSREG